MDLKNYKDQLAALQVEQNSKSLLAETIKAHSVKESGVGELKEVLDTMCAESLNPLKDILNKNITEEEAAAILYFKSKFDDKISQINEEYKSYLVKRGEEEYDQKLVAVVCKHGDL